MEIVKGGELFFGGGGERTPRRAGGPGLLGEVTVTRRIPRTLAPFGNADRGQGVGASALGTGTAARGFCCARPWEEGACGPMGALR